ncbi:MAG: methylmalonyl-CoA mutase family protein [Bosea sp. (in: a-proteobacteria)]
MTEPNSFADAFPAASEADWRVSVEKVLKGADFTRKLVNTTADGIAIQPLYAKAAGEVTTGANPGQRWQVCARVDHPDTDEAARQALDDLEGGADALALVMPGSLSARGAGVACETVAQLDGALKDVALDLIAVRLEPAPAGRINAGLFAALVKRRGYAPGSMRVDFGIDPLGIACLRGLLPATWTETSRRLAQSVADLREIGFTGPILTADGRPYHEAGATPAQELAAVLATLVAYLRALEAAGHGLEAARGSLSAMLAADGEQFITIAKFRALRRLWKRVEVACSLSPNPLMLHAETSWRMMTRRDPHVNMLRATIAAFSAGLGGADSVTVLPFTQAIGLPDAFARRVARNTQSVLLEEAHLWRVADPAAGSGGLEGLTEALCEKAWALFQEIERAGGMVKALESGHVSGQIATARAAVQRDVATRRNVLTGTSAFPNLSELPVNVSTATSPPAAKLGHGVTKAADLTFTDMVARLAAGASRIDVAPAPAPTRAVPTLPSMRLAEPFEALRDRADAQEAATGTRPAIFLAVLGPVTAHAARAAFARDLFEAGGIRALNEGGFAEGEGTDLVALTEAFKASGAKLVCICGTDDSYATEATDAAMALMASGASAVWMAGRPGELEPALRAAGVGGFVFAGCDAVAVLEAAFVAIA